MATWYNKYTPTALPAGWGKPGKDGFLELSEERKAAYTKLAKETATKLLEAAYDTTSFSKASTKEGVQVQWREAGELFLIRGRTTFPGRISMLDAWRAADTSGHYCTIMSFIDPEFVCGRTVAHITGKATKRDGGFNVTEPSETPFLAIRWSMFDAPWPLWKRDMVHLEYNAALDDGTFVQATCSVDLPECPSLEPNEIAVRAELGPSGYVWRNLDDGMVELVYCVELDAKGSVPKWVQNAVAPQQALNAARIRDSLAALARSKAALNGAGGTLDSISLHLDVPSGKEHTVGIAMKPGQKLQVEFMPKEKDIGLRCEGTEEPEWHKTRRFKTGQLHRVEMTCAGKEIMMCWDNTYSRFTDKTVYGRHRIVPIGKEAGDIPDDSSSATASVGGAGAGAGAGAGSA